MKGFFLADFFSGDGGVAKAARRLGVDARCWGTRNGDAFDLTKASVQRRARQDVAAGCLRAAMLAPPCTSFGSAGNRSFPARSAERPWGKPAAELTEKQRERVAAGNTAFRASLALLKTLRRARAPWIFERPQASFASKTPELEKLSRCPRVHQRT